MSFEDFIDWVDDMYVMEGGKFELEILMLVDDYNVDGEDFFNVCKGIDEWVWLCV